VGPHGLHLYADYDRRLPNTDPDDRDLLLGYGASLNHCVVGLAALGWQTKVHRFPNPGDDEHLAAIELHRHTAADVDVALAATIPRRRTDRRYYGSWPVPHGDIALMGARAARAGVTLRRVEALTDILEPGGSGCAAARNRLRVLERADHLERTVRLEGRCPRPEHTRI